jgi:hypothetical protein
VPLRPPQTRNARTTILFYFCSCNLDIEYSITVRISHAFQELNYFIYIPPWGAHYNIKI